MFVGSTDLMSSEHTSRFLVPFLRWLIPDITESTLFIAQLFVRKCAHLAEYAVLAVLFFRALSQSKIFSAHSVRLTFILAAIYALLDEFHQSFVMSRTASPYDVAIDLAGATAGLFIYRRLSRQLIRNPQSGI